MKQNILIIGPPASGKSTFIQETIKGKKVSGITTLEIRKDGQRWGFKVVNVRNGREAVFASVEMKPHVASRYGVHIEHFEDVAIPAIEDGIKSNSIIVIDEIGNMELISDKFRKLVLKAFDTKRVLATISMKTRHDFLNKIKSRSDVRVHYLTRANFERIGKEIRDEL